MDVLNRIYRKGHYRIHISKVLKKAGVLLTVNLMAVSLVMASTVPPPLNIPQIPLIMSSPIHPQVLIAIGNSQSMDGVLSGAIMPGSGSLSSSLSSLFNSSSPVNYTVPANFTPPLQGPDGSGEAPYTVTQSGNLVDNSPSRLNVAKAGVKAIIENYMASTDFALEVYQTSSVGRYNTWVYYMSPDGEDFSFTNTPDPNYRYVVNPCYNYGSASSTISSNCSSMAVLFGSTTLSSNQYMKIGASSDDQGINDVLYAGSGLPGVFVSYNGPNPSSPFPPNFSLSNYNNGNILISYSSTRPSIGGFATAPTNAGFVPFSRQVMYSLRGFGYYSSQSATSGNILVPMTTAGTNPTTTSVNNAINTFLPYLKPETNSTGTSEIKGLAVQSPLAGLLTRAQNYLVALSPTSGNGCPQKKYVILISDGLPTQDLNGRFWPPLGSAAAAGYGVSATFNADGSLNSTNSQALTDTISVITDLKNNDIETYIIGLGAGVDPTINPQAAATLTAMAVAGGTQGYYPATDSASLVNNLNNIMISIQNGSFFTSSAAVSSTFLNGSTVEYQANFVSSDTPYQDWTGNLQAIALDPDTGVPTNTLIWSAQGLLDTKVSGSGWSTNRIVATWNPTAGAGVPFRWASLDATQQGQLQPSDTLGENRLDYLRGNSALEVRNGGTFRNRSHILGDIIDSQVVFVGMPAGPYNSASYQSFVTAQVNRTAMLYVGANDGMLHGFNAATGQEVFSFIPNGVFGNLFNLTAPLYNQSHLFFVDGSPQSGDVQFSDGSWHTILVGGENAGGKSIYALDVTNPSSFSSEANLAAAVLWEFTDADMGLSYSKPQIARIGSASDNPANFAVFFGNGYNSTSNKDVLYAINPQTGAVIRKIDLCAAVSGSCNSSYAQGLSSVTVANKDGLQSDPITHVYAGDLQGNLWSVDVSNPDPNQWTVRLLFKATDAGGSYQPITTAPVVSLHPNYPRYQGAFVMFGTGQILIPNDLLDLQTQTVYGVWDKPGSSTTYNRGNLQQQVLTLVGAATSGLSTSILTATSNPINWNSQLGWYADLPTAGQRIVTNPALVNGAFIVTLNTPPATSCGITFSSMLLELNFATGGAFNLPRIDINGDGGYDASDQYNGLNPVGIGLSNSFANAPTILGPNSFNNIVLLITQSSGVQTTIFNTNNTPRKIGWWQLE
ncbi:type IV fimbrial biogenesis PilY1-like protein [Legionella spiritensis]|uniref:Type IV fimbrial biogenesis PilY1-like protein n=2 Tax=Legionella spiritensis TaxID=452 RepID=A0A0W0YWP8_LEGSP|nr:PilC/PilY family type IV pilus protein [Legionella spiritensis]KTD61119.1 type IV fimbrial biogenesis PilY1-like protein [Legionella spiritensis]SNV45014.1 type IV fimbrial biogenesis PilY1-like protein [Legionella spiritensis]